MYLQRNQSSKEYSINGPKTNKAMGKKLNGKKGRLL